MLGDDEWLIGFTHMDEKLVATLKDFITPEVIEITEEKLAAKDQMRRFDISLFILDQLLQEGPHLIDGTADVRLEEWDLCVASVLDLWKAAECLWINGHFAAATALAISTLEETGKLAVERFRLLGADKIEMSDETRSRLAQTWKKRRTPFFDHLSKSVMAAMSGALVNARLDRVVGMEFVITFLDNTEGGHLEKLRQGCLYLERKDGHLSRPQNVINKEEAAKYVSLAGEVLAEILPLPKEWEAMLELVKTFEETAGLPH